MTQPLNSKIARRPAYPTKHKLKPGDRFGKLTVISKPWKYDNGRTDTRYTVICDCSKGQKNRPKFAVLSVMLVRGDTRSCGCNYKEAGQRLVTHGQTGCRLFRIWESMLHRCDPKKSQMSYYSRYAGRGIRVCGAWLTSYEAFREWALANGYSDGLSIDRIDSDGHYCPENCRWVTRSTQARNRKLRHGSSKYRCVIKIGDRWEVRYSLEGESVLAGYFADEIEAARAYDRVCVERQLPSPTNFPVPGWKEGYLYESPEK